MPRRSGHFASALAEPRFALFAAGQFISQFGDYLAQIALIAAVGAFTTRAPLAYSQITVAIALPALLFGPIIGVVVDRRSKRALLMKVDALRALVVLSIPVSMKLTGSVLVLFPLVFVNYLLTLFANAARGSLIPYLVPPEKIFAANSVMDFGGKLAGVLGFVGGGLLVSGPFWRHLRIEPWEAGFYLDSLTFLASVVAVLLLKVTEPPIVRHQDDGWRAMWERRLRNFREDLRELWVLARADGRIRFVMLSLLLVSIFGGTLYPLIVVIVQKAIRVGAGAGTSGVGLLGGVLGAGMMLGSLSIGFLGHHLSRRRIIVFGLLGLSVAVMVFSRCGRFWELIPVALAGGMFLAPVMVAQNTMLHEAVPHNLWGRAFSWKDIVLDAGFMASALVFGAAAQFVLPALGTVNHEKVVLFWAGALLAALTAAMGVGLAARRRAPGPSRQ